LVALRMSCASDCAQERSVLEDFINDNIWVFGS
jgi:hypothetical protein